MSNQKLLEAASLAYSRFLVGPSRQSLYDGDSLAKELFVAGYAAAISQVEAEPLYEEIPCPDPTCVDGFCDQYTNKRFVACESCGGSGKLYRKIGVSAESSTPG